MNKAEREEFLRQKLIEMSRYEERLWRSGVRFVAGVDEVGRGPLAGPVCAAAVILPEGFDVIGVDDSKKLTEKRREALFEKISEKAIAIGIGLVENDRIDEINILGATKEAMLKALDEAGKNLAAIEQDNEEYKGDGPLSSSSPRIGHLLVDAIKLPEAKIPGTAIIRGDQKSVSIAAASIIAKVTRDRLMIEFDKIYPGYGFASNKGYGTKAHYEGLKKLGLTPIHRLSFLKNFNY